MPGYSIEPLFDIRQEDELLLVVGLDFGQLFVEVVDVDTILRIVYVHMLIVIVGRLRVALELRSRRNRNVELAIAAGDCLEGVESARMVDGR